MDISLNFIDKGMGDPLVLLHGNGESTAYFKMQIDYFSAFRRVIAVDTRGHGASPRGTGPFTLSRFADDLREFLDTLGIVKADLLGFSDGGNIALLFALRYPGHVRRLILNGANLYPAGMKTAVWLSVFLDWCRCAIASAFSREAARRKELLELMLLEPHIRPAALDALDLPVLVIVGRHDMIRQCHSEKICRALKRGTLVVLPGSHFIAAENSNAFNAAVAAFLSG